MIQIRDFYVPVYFIYVLAQSLGGARNTPERSTTVIDTKCALLLLLVVLPFYSVCNEITPYEFYVLATV